MKKNRLLSAFLAGALMVSAMPFQAFAADITDPPAGGGTITGDSTVVSQAQVRVVVPANTDFLVNPLELDVSGVSDQIISAPFTFINKSNMDVQLSVSPEFTSDSGITVASSPDEIKNTIGEAPTIFLQVAPATTKPDLKGAGDTLEFDDATTPTFTSGDGISTTVTEEADGVTPNTTYFKLENLKKAYSVDTVTDPDAPKMEYDQTKATPADTDAVALKFIGKVSQMSTWTGITPKVRFHYEFNLISKEVYADNNNEVAGAHGLVNKNLAMTASIVLNADGTFETGGLNKETQTVAGLYYIVDDSITGLSYNDIKAVVKASDFQTKMDAAGGNIGLPVGSYMIKQMKFGNGFTSINPDKEDGVVYELSDAAKNNVFHDKDAMMVTVVKEKDTGALGELLVSPVVHMD